jgi:hypothetical protein
MQPSSPEFEILRGVLAEADEPLTAREIHQTLKHDEFESPQGVATILGRRADRGEVRVITRNPYYYELES